MTTPKLSPAIFREAMARDDLPVLLYDKSAIRRNFQTFQDTLKNVGATFSFAVKAFAHDEVFEIASDFVHGFDISNLNEWKKVRPHMRPGHIVWFTNGKYTRELDHIIKEVNTGFLRVVLNDLDDYKRVKGKEVKYLIRLCTSSLVEQPHASRFGLTISELTNLKDTLLHDPFFSGFHIHQGVEDNSFKILNPILVELEKNLSPFKDRNFTMNLGGGYHNFSQEELLETLNFFKNSFKVHIEPGRTFVNNAGYALAPVEKFIKSGKTLRIFTPLSISAHLKWSVPSIAGVINLSEGGESFDVEEILIEGPTCYEYDRIRSLDVKGTVKISNKSFIVLSKISGYSREWNTSFNGIEACEVKFFG